MKDTLFIAFQRLCPQHAISRLAGLIASSENAFIKRYFISWFIKRYRVDMSLALKENPEDYKHFNDFFTRELKPNARPITQESNAITCPADGAISQIGKIDEDRIFQAKGHDFSLTELLGGDSALAKQFENGNFATIYLSPRDYHRVHMPLSGELTKTVYVPGELFSVNDVTVSHVPRLFARNERLVCSFSTAHGPMVVILVGAMIVASIETPWGGVVVPQRRKVRTTKFGRKAPKIVIEKGEEVGRFLLGSTAIVLFGKDMMNWEQDYTAGSPTTMGQTLGSINKV